MYLAAPLVLILALSSPLFSWSEHTMMSHRVFVGLPEFAGNATVSAKSLKAFLVEEQKGIEELLNKQEQWSRGNMPSYAPRPDTLAFQAGKGNDDIVERFFRAIRINPGVKVRLYVDLLPGESRGPRPLISPDKLTTLTNHEFMKATEYAELREGERVSTLMVLASSNNEPDYGFDLGLFEDNGTAFGAVYGFGKQTFGNPNLEYSSQAPFHMGFYHEPGIVFFFAPFLKRTYPEYRIHLFRTLAEYAFKNGQDYWGWRFMGWGMHYLGDLSMPYHSSPLPGISAFSMIWTNLKAMIGFPKSKDDAIQLVSNRHTVMEKFQAVELRRAYTESITDHPFLKALGNPAGMVDYRDDFPRNVTAKESVVNAEILDEAIEKYMPPKTVSDPSFEVSGSPELETIVSLTEREMGAKAVEGMRQTIADLFKSYGMHLRSYMKAILESSRK